jgi:predicted permease
MALALQIVQIVAPVFLLAGVGWGWVRIGWDYDIAFVTRLAMSLSLPCLIFMALVRVEIETTALQGIVLAALAAYIAVGILVWAVLRLAGLSMAAFWAPVTFGNTGNLGLPVAYFAFGQAGLDLAVLVFAVAIFLSFSFGIWAVAGGSSLSAAFKEPLFWGTVLGMLFFATGWSVPEWIGNSLDLTGQIAIPLMLITLGVAMSRLKPAALGQALWLSPVKLAICASVSLAVGLWFSLPPVALGVLMLQVSTPVAVTSYLLAAKFNARADEVAGLVTISTIMSVVAIPVLLAFFV